MAGDQAGEIVSAKNPEERCVTADVRRGTLVLAAAVGAMVLGVVSTSLRVSGTTQALPAPCTAPADVESRIRFHAAQVADNPRLYPSLALLAKAYLDRVRWTGDAYDLAAARDCLVRSIAIQPNLAAYKVSAAVANYSHRFEEALRWCDLAADAAPGDPEILAMRSEALLALDRPDDVAALLENVDAPEKSFHAVACRGMLAAAREDRSKALVDFASAARLAEQLGSPELRLWAHVTSAAQFLDHGQPADAEPYLRTAGQIDPDDYDRQVHLAEFEEGTGLEAEALVRYELLLTQRCDAEVHRRMYILAARLGLKGKAARHYAAAERLWRAALDLGEVYPLEGLAKLYCDAGRNLEDAVRLAERNLEYKRDASARETLKRAVELRSRR
jgi:tetratricopeptide (TPR) repeat protein